MIPLLLIVSGNEHSHDHSGDFWSDFLAIATDPAHLAFELVFSVVFDLLIVSFIYGVIIRKIIIPKLRRDIHKQIDEEHGFNDEDHNPPTSGK